MSEDLVADLLPTAVAPESRTSAPSGFGLAGRLPVHADCAAVCYTVQLTQVALARDCPPRPRAAGLCAPRRRGDPQRPTRRDTLACLVQVRDTDTRTRPGRNKPRRHCSSERGGIQGVRGLLLPRVVVGCWVRVSQVPARRPSMRSGWSWIRRKPRRRVRSRCSSSVKAVLAGGPRRLHQSDFDVDERCIGHGVRV